MRVYTIEQNEQMMNDLAYYIQSFDRDVIMYSYVLVGDYKDKKSEWYISGEENPILKLYTSKLGKKYYQVRDYLGKSKFLFNIKHNGNKNSFIFIDPEDKEGCIFLNESKKKYYNIDGNSSYNLYGVIHLLEEIISNENLTEYSFQSLVENPTFEYLSEVGFIDDFILNRN